jgi:ribonuclease HII
VAAAVMLRSFQKISNGNFVKDLDLIRDSKTLSEKQREKVFDFIEENFFVGVGICDHETIDRMNILEASFLAMKGALTSLKSKIKNQDAKFIILVDGNKKIPNLSADQRAIVGGDKIVKSISAASIIAKVTRDRMMKSISQFCLLPRLPVGPLKDWEIDFSSFNNC